MTILNLVLSGAILLIVIFVILYLSIRLHNKNAKADLDRLLSQTSNLTSTCFMNIKISHLVANGLKYYPSVNNTADIYLFDQFIAILRRQNSIFKIYFKPCIISKEPETVRHLLKSINIVKPDKIVTRIPGKIEIYTTDQQYQHHKTTITLKGLSDEQARKLSAIFAA